MRPTIIPNLLRFIEKNLARSIKNMAFFEIGPIFSGLQPTDELTFVSGVRCGAYMDKNAHTNGRDYDIFDLKADLETLFDYIGISIDKCALNLLAPSYYHPARAASIALGSNIIGYFGQIHPQVLKYFGISEAVFAFELNIMNIPFAKAKFGKRGELQVSDFQMNFRDYAFVLDPNQSVGEIINYISNFNKKLVKSVRLFDIYSGDKLAENKKSIAIKVQLQADDRTLTEQDLNKFSTDLILAVEQKFQGKLRG
jgi:phenylalanyl-tRNA synthetase beta chain